MSDAARDSVASFVAQPVPPSGTEAWRRWQAAARKLGAECAPALVATLEHGTESEQYAALLVLRMLAYEAYGEGYYAELFYRVRAPGEAEARIIKPIILPVPS